MKYFFLLFLLAFTVSHSQTYKVNLTTRTALDDNGFHISAFYDNPKEELKLPDINLSNDKFFYLYLGGKDGEDHVVSILFLRKENKDLLYIDSNNDEDLTNDKSPYIFPDKEKYFTFNIYPSNDINQYVKYGLSKKMIASDSAMQKVIDTLFYNPDGDLKKNIYMPFTVNSPSFKGEKHTYFCDYRNTLSRGKLLFPNDTLKIGLFDYTNNGLFNDIHDGEGDVILIDVNGDGELSYSNDNEIFYLDEIFEINGKNYRINTIDPYGKYLTIEKTDSVPNYKFLKYKSNLSGKNSQHNSFKLDDGFWKYTFTDIDGNTVHTSSFKNKTLLINFWGEWCKPCITEIPELIALNKETDISIISFLKTTNLITATEVIEEKHMNWTHILLDKEMEQKFNLHAYPTNILISKNGKVLFNLNQINRFNVYKFLGTL